jgi:hypothetical protein
MKDQLSFGIAVAAMAYLAVRIYQKYIKKDQGGKNTAQKSSTLSSSRKEDDYEPYSKK